MSLSSLERHGLADALLRVGPDAPTLCAGWTARELAAHLVVREQRPDSLPGLVVTPLAGWTDRVRRRAARASFEDLVERFRSGPPPWSPFALPGVDARAGLTEHFVHHEDVLRARRGWLRRELPDRERAALWRAVYQRGGMLYRSSPVGVVLVVPGRQRLQVKKADVSVVLTGQPEELLLHAFGRTGHARVEVSGPQDAVAEFAEASLGV